MRLERQLGCRDRIVGMRSEIKFQAIGELAWRYSPRGWCSVLESVSSRMRRPPQTEIGGTGTTHGMDQEPGAHHEGYIK